MNPLLWTNLQVAHWLGRTFLVMPWLGPSALGLGILGTRSGHAGSTLEVRKEHSQRLVADPPCGLDAACSSGSCRNSFRNIEA